MSNQLDSPEEAIRGAGWRHRRLAAGMYLSTVVAGLLMIFLGPSLFGHPYWCALGDYKWTIESAQYVTFGGLGHVYQANVQFLPLPGFLMILAPAVALGDHLGYVNPLPFPMQHPSMWLVAAPVMMLTGAVAVPGADYLADSLGLNRAKRGLIGAFTGAMVVLPSCIWAGHPEDMLCMGLSSFSLGLLIKGRHRQAAVVLALAVLMQPYAVLLIPLVVMASPVRLRWRVGFCACALPALMGLTLWALDPSDAFRSLVIQPMQGNGQHLPWWGMTHPLTVYDGSTPNAVRVGSSPRFLAVLTALIGAWWIRRRVTPLNVVLVAALAFVARSIFESQVWSWYLGPAAVLLFVLTLASPGLAVHLRIAGLLFATTFYLVVIRAYQAVAMPSLLAFAILVLTSAVPLWMSARAFLGRPPAGEPLARPSEWTARQSAVQLPLVSAATAASTPLTKRPESSVL